MTDDWQPQISEEYDHTWPYNFKWGVSAEGDVMVWRVTGGVQDGKPYHRPELERVWGRPVHIGSGDVIGTAQYVPAEIKLDQTIVSPPEIQVQVYYHAPLPTSLVDWFEQRFPGTVVREAAYRSPRKPVARVKTAQDADWNMGFADEGDEVLKWIWNPHDGVLAVKTDPAGLPTHNMLSQDKWGRKTKTGIWVEGGNVDFLGYAIPTGNGTLEIEEYGGGIPQKGMAAVKTELSKIFPDLKILTPSSWNDPREEFYDPQFAGRDLRVQREAAIKWAWENIAGEQPPDVSVEGTEIDSKGHGDETEGSMPKRVYEGLKRLLGRRPVWATTGRDKEGAMIALFVPEEVGEQIKVLHGEPLEQLHITLVYFEDKYADRDDWDEIHRIVEQFANQNPSLSGSINGYGVFSNDPDVLWAVPGIKGLNKLREELVQAVEDAGFPINKEYEWMPHITLKYDFNQEVPILDDPIEVTFDDLAFAQGDDKTLHSFGGNIVKEGKVIQLPGEWQPHNDYDDGRRTYIYLQPTDTIYLAPNNAYHHDIWNWLYQNVPQYKDLFVDWGDHMDDGLIALGFFERGTDSRELEARSYWAEGQKLPDHILEEVSHFFGEKVYQRDWEYPPQLNDMNHPDYWFGPPDDYESWSGGPTKQWPESADQN